MKEIQEIKVGLKLKQKKDNPLPGINGMNGVTIDSIFEIIAINKDAIFVKTGPHRGVFAEEELRKYLYEVKEQSDRLETKVAVFGKEQPVTIFTNENKRTVVALMDYDGVKIRGIAKCMEEDEFSVEIGRRIAISKALVKFYQMYKEKINNQCEHFIMLHSEAIAQY